MSSYLTPAQFTLRTVAPATAVTEVESAATGWLQAQLDTFSALVDSRLAKRYVTPFADPPPEVVLNWLTRIVTVQLYLKRGFDPNDAQSAAVVADRDLVYAELKEAADAVHGLFELPLRSDLPGSTGISKGRPMSRSDADPYSWTDRQALTVRGYS